MGAQRRNLDGFLSWLASRQKGLATRRQILAAGFTPRQVGRRIASGSLMPLYSGIYLVGHRALGPLTLEAAAILACSPRTDQASRTRPTALLSGITAARIDELPVPAGGPIHVTLVCRRRRPLKGVRLHHIEDLAPCEIRRVEGLPLTSPSLTILDLAGLLRADELAAALNEARVQRLVREDELWATLGRHPQRRGAAALRKLLTAERGPKIIRSEAERRALALMRRHGLEPETDVRIGPWRPDFLFRAEGVVVEVDGYRYHSTPDRFVRDRRRAADLAARGLVVVSLTWDDLGPASEAAMARLIRTLDNRRST